MRGATQCAFDHDRRPMLFGPPTPTMAEPDPKDASPKSSRPPRGASEPTRPGELLHSSSIFGPTGFGPVELARARPGTGSAFDVCHVGVVLRALLFVHGVLAVGVSFAAASVKDWLGLVGLAASLALPAVLLWLVLACLLKRQLAVLRPPGQWVAA